MRSLLIFLAALLLCAPAQAQVAGGDYDSDAQFYFDVLAANSCIATTPAFKLAVSHYIQAEKVAGNWGNQDAEYLLATSDSCTAAINLAQPALSQSDMDRIIAHFSGARRGLNGDGSTDVLSAIPASINPRWYPHHAEQWRILRRGSMPRTITAVAILQDRWKRDPGFRVMNLRQINA